MSAIGKVFVGIGIIVVAVAVTVGVAIGGRELGWWLKADNTNRQTKIENLSYSHQTALKDQVLNDAKDIGKIDAAIPFASPEYKVTLKGQRIAIVADMCDAAGSLSGTVNLSASAESLVNQECA